MSIAPGFISRLASHPRSPLHEERENRLTEVCAAVLDSKQCFGLARELAIGWLAEGQAQERVPAAVKGRLGAMRDLLQRDPEGWDCAISTQTSVSVEGKTRRPDLLLTFTRPREPDTRQVVVCVENKCGTEPHTDQLRAYQQWLHNRGITDDGAVVLVGPRSEVWSFDSEQVPDEVPRLTWQRTAAIIARHRPDSANQVGRFLVDELCKYLQEENLMDPERLTPEHLIALTAHKQAVRALNVICELAADSIGAPWIKGAHDTCTWSEGEFERGYEHWWAYGLPDDDARKQAIDPGWGWGWHLRLDSSSVLRDGRPGAPCFMAGVAADDGGRIKRLTDGTVAALQEQAFLVLAPGDTKERKREYIWRVAYPEELLAGADTQSQAQPLARWITKAFDDLSALLAANGPRPAT